MNKIKNNNKITFEELDIDRYLTPTQGATFTELLSIISTEREKEGKKGIKIKNQIQAEESRIHVLHLSNLDCLLELVLTLRDHPMMFYSLNNINNNNNNNNEIVAQICEEVFLLDEACESIDFSVSSDLLSKVLKELNDRGIRTVYIKKDENEGRQYFSIILDVEEVRNCTFKSPDCIEVEK